MSNGPGLGGCWLSLNRMDSNKRASRVRLNYPARCSLYGELEHNPFFFSRMGSSEHTSLTICRQVISRALLVLLSPLLPLASPDQDFAACSPATELRPHQSGSMLQQLAISGISHMLGYAAQTQKRRAVAAGLLQGFPTHPRALRAVVPTFTEHSAPQASPSGRLIVGNAKCSSYSTFVPG
ncbi:uncharacterized protein B0I36DRAFT_30912 [Microdochium trichocladiopsis]|uniref:Uncharacterized protein n=1 Tax=Microdochium trichocladiopsis TaxID=1682393 RepID=A0A9P9BI70_9PEZI|nr:uncharacterized protein B0I36DRAFT_30912 [Microdochium trichocladiopsis]KAH7021280.1 hypothetical protein B0I36DRAFT_30912 [Microdochium trichocladiopsis]